MAVRPVYEAIEDRYLVAASLAGRTEAYDELVRRYHGAIVLLAWRTVGSRETAHDVAQEVFLTAFQQLAQLRDPGQFGAWIRVIAQNRSRRVQSREDRSRPFDTAQLNVLLDSVACDCAVHPAEALLHQERDSAIRNLVGALTPGVQIVLQLYYSEQWSVARIAEFLSLTTTTVKWRLHSGRKRIARDLATLLSEDAAHGGQLSK